MKDILPFLFYIAGSVCFIVGSVLALLNTISK
jgi:hypothetical protein